MIRCGHCGGQHATVAAVRACSAPGGDRGPCRRGPRGRPVRRWAFDAGPPDARPIGPPDRQTGAWSWPVLAGPEALGRNVVVGPGQAAPEPWSGADRLVIDDRTELATILDVLRERAHRRVRSVLELHLDLDGALDAVEERPPYSLGPGFSFDLEVLHHLVWSNSVDARDPARPVWPWRDAALTLGATPATEADVTLPTGGRPGSTAGRCGSSTWSTGTPSCTASASSTGHSPRSGPTRPLRSWRPTRLRRSPTSAAAAG